MIIKLFVPTEQGYCITSHMPKIDSDFQLQTLGNLSAFSTPWVKFELVKLELLAAIQTKDSVIIATAEQTTFYFDQ